MPRSAPAPEPPDAQGRLSPFDATLFVMGGIIGVGIFFTPQIAAARVPGTLPFVGVWIFGGLVALCAALTFAELGAAFPRAGGWFVYLRETWGPFPAYLFAWVVLFVVSTGATATMTLFCADMLHRALPGLVGPEGTAGHRLVAAAIVVAVTVLAMSGVRRAALVQDLCMLTKLVVLGALVVAGFALVAPDSAASAAASAEVEGRRGVLSALLPVFYSYGGWQMICYLAPEVRDPARTLPRAIVTGLVAVVLVYLAFALAAVRGLGLEGVAADHGFAATLAREAAGAAGERVVALGMAVSALGVCIVTILGTPWLYVAMARERLFFASVGRLHPRTGAPVRALGIQCAVTLVYLALGTLATLVDAVVFVEWIFHGLVALGLLRLHRRRAEALPFRAPLHPLAPLVYLLAAALVVSSTIVEAPFRLWGQGLAIVAAGALVYRPWRRWLAQRDAARGIP